jgi:prolyl 4-hydroxylase
MHRLSGYDPSTYEELQVVRYVPGGYFHQHFDQCDMNDDYCQGQVKRFNGFRLYTLIIALSDPSEYSGGGTYFTHYKELVRLNKGDALLFQNVYPSPEDSEKSCTIDPRSMHEGKELKSGERYIATIWIRGRG